MYYEEVYIAMKPIPIILTLSLVVLLGVVPGMARAEMYSNTVVVEKVLTDFYPFYSVSYGWYHDNPAEIAGGGPLTPTEYYEAATPVWSRTLR